MDNNNTNNTPDNQNNNAQDSPKNTDNALGDVRKQLDKILEQMHKDHETSDFVIKALKDIDSSVKEAVSDIKKEMPNENIGKLSNVLSEDTVKGISDSISEIADMSREYKENYKEIQIHLDAMTETLSILQESNEHIKGIKEGITEITHDFQAKIDEISEALNKNNESMAQSLKEQAEAFGKTASENREFFEKTLKKQEDAFDNAMKDNREFFEKAMENMKGIYENIAKIAQQTEDIYTFEKDMSEKREKEFAMMQSRHHNEKGLVLFYRGVFSAALDHFFKALELEPQSAEILNNIGYAYLKKKEYNKAEEYFKKALDIFPDFSEAYNNLGLLYMDNSKYELAIENIKKAVTLFPDFAEAYYNLGNAHQSADNIDEAIENWNKAVEINPFHEEAKEKIKLFKKGDVNV